MRQTTTTLRKIAKTFRPSEFTLKDILATDFSSLSWQEKVEIASDRMSYKERIRVNTNPDREFLACEYLLTNTVRTGNRIYLKTKSYDLFIIRGNNIEVRCPKEMQTAELFNDVMPLFGRDTRYGGNTQIYDHFLWKPFMLKAVLTGRVYSEETFWRKVASQCYGLRRVEWKPFKKVMNSSFGMYGGMADIRDFSRNFQNSLRILADLLERRDGPSGMGVDSHLQMLRDALSNAVRLDEKIDFGWSYKRLREEHSRQVDTLMALKLASIDETLLYKNVEEACTDGFHLLSSERQVFQEGSRMHHCIYTNYFEHDAVDCTVGMRWEKKDNGEYGFTLDQIHTIRNGSVPQEIFDRARAFLDRTKDTLSMLTAPLRERAQVKGGFYDASDDMPF